MLWRYDEVFRLVITTTASALLLLFAYIGASGTAHLKHQGLWLNLAIGALVVGGFGATSFLLAGFRRVYLGVGEVLRTGTATEPAERPVDIPALVSVANTIRFHREDCVLAEGKAVVRGSQAQHRRAGRKSCEMCRP